MTALVVNGKQVVLRDNLPARDSWGILEILRTGSEDEGPSFDDEARLLSIVVLSWEFEGDPSDAESYAGLDLFSEFLPLRDAVGRHLNRGLLPQGGLDIATYRALTQGAPMPWEATKWLLVLRTGWTLEYIDSLDWKDIMEGLAVLAGLDAAKNA
ncbi:MAG TPA: hypothetical protein VM537_18535 [Anaerolineae bacterium]|nr:hypothetical protein [Anaerolineae bacterium]